MLSSLVVLGPTGHTVFEKHWREPITRKFLDDFWHQLQKEGGSQGAAPVQVVRQMILVHVSRGKLVLAGVLSHDVPALLVMELLHRVGDLLTLYLKELTEDAMRANFVTVYQLLDEIIDNGAPLHTEPNVLQQLVMQPGKIDSIMASVTGQSQVRAALPEASSSSAPWRRTAVRYAANEFYLDLCEGLDAVIDGRNGVLQRAEVWGSAMCNCLLSSMPRLTLSFTTPHVIEDVALHLCVDRERWDRERVLSFTPPDGKFELFSYRVARTNSLPVYVTPTISFVPSSGAVADDTVDLSAGAGSGPSVDALSAASGGGGVGHIQVTLGLRPTENRPVEEIAMRMPLPSSTASASLTATVGNVVYDPQAKEVVWKIGRIPKDKLPILSGTFLIGPGRNANELSLSLFVSFKVSMYSASGLKVAGLRVDNVDYTAYKGVRSITRSGNFEVRC